MTLAHFNTTPAIRDQLADLVADAIDLGSADAQGDLVFMAAADAEVATLLLANPAFGAASSAVATINAPSDDTNATGGVVTAFKFQNRDNQEVFRGSVTATGGGGDIEMTSTTIVATTTVSLGTFTYTASA